MIQVAASAVSKADYETSPAKSMSIITESRHSNVRRRCPSAIYPDEPRLKIFKSLLGAAFCSGSLCTDPFPPPVLKRAP
jgi:hypothetical protein